MPVKECEKEKYCQATNLACGNLKLVVNDTATILLKTPTYFTINNRRYLGNKYKLNEFIRNTIEKECGYFETFADLFAGTGSVASLFQDKRLIVNDILYSNYVCHQTWLGIEKYSKNKIESYIKRYNNLSVKSENYMSKNFANTFFSKTNCKKIGFIRNDIEENFNNCFYFVFCIYVNKATTDLKFLCKSKSKIQ